MHTRTGGIPVSRQPCYCFLGQEEEEEDSPDHDAYYLGEEDSINIDSD